MEINFRLTSRDRDEKSVALLDPAETLPISAVDGGVPALMDAPRSAGPAPFIVDNKRRASLS